MLGDLSVSCIVLGLSFSRFRRRRSHKPNISRARTAIPATKPPTIAPVFGAGLAVSLARGVDVEMLDSRDVGVE